MTMTYIAIMSHIIKNNYLLLSCILVNNYIMKCIPQWYVLFYRDLGIKKGFT